MYQGHPGLMQILLPRYSTALALLLVMLGMLWLGDACSDSLMDSTPVCSPGFLRYEVDSPDYKQDATVLLQRGVEFKNQVSARLAGIFADGVTARTRLRPQKRTVRGPPSISA